MSRSRLLRPVPTGEPAEIGSNAGSSRAARLIRCAADAADGEDCNERDPWPPLERATASLLLRLIDCGGRGAQLYQPRRETRRSSADIMYNCKGPPRHEEGQRVNSTASFLLSAGMLGDGEVYRYLFFCEPNVNCMLLVLDAADLESPRVFVYLQLSRSLPFRPRATLRFQCDTRFALHAYTPTPSFFYPAHATFLCFQFLFPYVSFYIYTICVNCIFYAVCGDREPCDAGETPDPLSLPGGACGGPVRLRRAY